MCYQRHVRTDEHHGRLHSLIQSVSASSATVCCSIADGGMPSFVGLLLRFFRGRADLNPSEYPNDGTSCGDMTSQIAINETYGYDDAARGVSRRPSQQVRLLSKIACVQIAGRMSRAFREWPSVATTANIRFGPRHLSACGSVQAWVRIRLRLCLQSRSAAASPCYSPHRPHLVLSHSGNGPLGRWDPRGAGCTTALAQTTDCPPSSHHNTCEGRRGLDQSDRRR